MSANYMGTKCRWVNNRTRRTPEEIKTQRECRRGADLFYRVREHLEFRDEDWTPELAAAYTWADQWLTRLHNAGSTGHWR